jgi:hypothetical protein
MESILSLQTYAVPTRPAGSLSSLFSVNCCNGGGGGGGIRTVAAQ